MKKNIFIISAVILAGILLVVLVNTRSNSGKTIEFKDINSVIESKTEGIIYVSQTNEDAPYSQFFKNEYKLKIMKTNASIDEVNEFLSSTDVDKVTTLPCFIVFADKKPIGVVDGTLSESETNEMFRYYYFNELPSKMIAYKTLSTADEYIKKVNSKELTVAIFGYDECSYCNLYKPVFNKVAKDNNLNIYYFDSRKYDENEYNKIMKIDLTIPAKCTMDGKETTMLEGFPKPMTLITKNGKLVDCIKGYVNEDTLVKKLVEVKVLKGK